RDASCVVQVGADQLEPVGREHLDDDNRADQERLRDLHAEKERKPLLPLAQARENRQRVSFEELPVPEFTGRRLVEPDLATLREYIDWQFFFHAWELKGKFPQILDQPAAKELYEDAQRLLDRIRSEEHTYELEDPEHI